MPIDAGCPKAPRRDMRSPFLIIRVRWRRDCLEREYTTRRSAPSVRWSTKGRVAPQAPLSVYEEARVSMPSASEPA
jgi:hypothetical protein